MIQLDLIQVAGFESAFTAMRLPKKSVGDSGVVINENTYQMAPESAWMVGPNDLSLAQRLILAGDEHAKCMRGIEAWIKVEMSLYWMIELDTYHVGVDVLSTSSSMHTDLKNLKEPELSEAKGKIGGDYRYTRIFKANYQALRRIYFQRRHHRLDDWKYFCNWIEDNLPLAKELITLEAK